MNNLEARVPSRIAVATKRVTRKNYNRRLGAQGTEEKLKMNRK
jgi:hypothetical protein